MMSAKNAWGTSTGYAEELRDKGVETSRAQQLENWANQQEVRAKNQQLREMSENFDAQQTSAEENWRQLAKFGVERVADFDLDEEFGDVTVGEVEGVIELKSALNKVTTHEFGVSSYLSLGSCFIFSVIAIISYFHDYSISSHFHLLLSAASKPLHGIRGLSCILHS
jgi:hypothetical protein